MHEIGLLNPCLIEIKGFNIFSLPAPKDERSLDETVKLRLSVGTEEVLRVLDRKFVKQHLAKGPIHPPSLPA